MATWERACADTPRVQQQVLGAGDCGRLAGSRCGLNLNSKMKESRKRVERRFRASKALSWVSSFFSDCCWRNCQERKVFVLGRDISLVRFGHVSRNRLHDWIRRSLLFNSDSC